MTALMSGTLPAQRESYNWFFGSNAGITFNTPNTEPDAMLSGALNSAEGCAAISDGTGRLLFYTDGETVWNKNHVRMPGGTGLSGDRSSTQSAIIIPRPGQTNLYYILTTDDSSGALGCRYSVVDMNGQGGLGDVVEKNVLLFNESTEKLVGIKHANGRDWWVLTHEWNSDAFRAYLINSTGINPFAVFSIAGTTHRGNLANKTGYMKASINGTKLALVLPADGIIELFEFDNSTGKVHSSIHLSSLVFKDAYGLEFSKSGHKLYVSKREEPSAILQFDISSWSPSAILNTQTLIYDIKEQGAFQAMQIGPDNKIYVARNERAFLGRINSPEAQGKACDYIDSAVSLKGQRSQKGLPNIYSSDIIKLNLKSNSPVCIGDSLRLFTDYIFGAKYDWTGPNGFSSSLQNPVVQITSNQQSGYYVLKMNVSNVEYIDSTYVMVEPAPSLDLKTSETGPYCEGDSIVISALTADVNIVLWNTGDTTKSIVARKSGNYKATVYNAAGCSSTEEISLTFQTIPTEIVPLSSAEFCIGDSVELAALPLEAGAYVSWSTGEVGASIVVKKTDLIIMTVRTTSGCVKHDTISVRVYENLKFEIQTIGQFCKGDTVELTTNYTGQDFIYTWSNGLTTPSIKITNNMKGWVYVRLNSGCGDTAFFDYQFNIKPDLIIISDKSLTACKGETITLTAIILNTNEHMSFLWSTGDTSKSIAVIEAGQYSVTVTSDSGCSNSSYVEVNFLDSPEIEILPNGSTNLCEGEFLKLTTSPVNNELSYMWSTGETTADIVVNQTGTYFVVATNNFNCEDTAFIDVRFNPMPIVEIVSSGPLRLCKGNTVNLSTKDNYSTYLWNTGDTTDNIDVQNAGRYWVTIVDSNGCNGRSEEIDITVSEVDIEIDNLSKSKFGNVCITDTKEQEILFKNNGKEAIFVNSINISNGDDFVLQTEPLLPSIIPPGADIVVKIVFNPIKLGYYIDTMKLSVLSPCFYEFSIILEGTGIARTTAEIPEIERPIGTRYCIPVYMKLDCGDTLNERVYFRTLISLDYSMFLPDSVLHPFVKSSYLSGSRRFFEIEGYIDTLGRDKIQLFDICGTVMYGNYEWDPIVLDNFTWNKANISTVPISGELQIYGLCEFDISRIKFNNPSYINISQYGTSGRIEINVGTEEQGRHYIIISNLNGQVIYSQDFDNQSEGFKMFEYYVDLASSNSGYFLAALRSPNGIRSVPFIIYR